MIRDSLSIISRFFLLVLLQVLVLNNIQFSGYINPYMYILFILVLPFETPGWLLLVSGFLLGISIDLFANTPGMHASATVFVAFLRPHVLKLIAPRDGYEGGEKPGIKDLGLEWFLKYSIVITVAHHLFLFYIEVFRFAGFFHTMGRVLLSSIFTLILIVLSQYLFYRR